MAAAAGELALLCTTIDVRGKKGGGRGQGHYNIKSFIMAYFNEFAICWGIFQRMNFVVIYFKSENFVVACI